MECYYIVISSAHLSKGHFRNVKGVFRGPLTASKSLELAEEENTRGNALETLKANFYCELCDKQYHKHQEFDNHINSYDHAHKQRLKELKHREFSRNIASKIRKNERKQKKYLQRLHKLAVPKKETNCAPGSGPKFKSTTVTVHDHVSSSLQKTVVDSAERKSPHVAATIVPSAGRENPPLAPISNLHNSTNLTSILVSSAENSENNTENMHTQLQKDKEQKISFSFAFPKRTPVKLQASAAVFYDFNKDISGGHGLTRRSRFLPGSFSVQSSLPMEGSSCPNNDQKSISACEKQSPRIRHASHDLNQKEMDEKEIRTFLSNNVCNFKVPLDHDVQAQSVNSEIYVQSKDKGGECQPGNEQLVVECYKSEASDVKQGSFNNHHGLLIQPVENSMQKEEITVANDFCDSNNCIKTSLDCLTSNEDGKLLKKKNTPSERLVKDFVPVYCKDRSKILQWPSEMIMYTSTQPSISYSCNPLYFDFRSSKATDKKEKTISQESHLSNHLTQCYSNNYHCSKPNMQLDCNTFRKDYRKDTCRQRAKTSNNVKCYSLICTFKDDQKHSISKYLMNKDSNSEVRQKNKSHRKAYTRKKRNKNCKWREQVRRTSKFRPGKKCQTHGNCQSCSTNLVHGKSKDSFYSLENLTFRHQLPHAEIDHTETELLRSPRLQIKKECVAWKAEYKRIFANQIENKHSKNAGPFNYQSDHLQLDHRSHNITYSQTVCSWSSDKMSSNHEKHEAFLKHSCTFKRTHRSVVDEIELSLKRPRLCRSFLYSQEVIFPEENFTILCKSITIRENQAVNDTIIRSRGKQAQGKLALGKLNLEDIGRFQPDSFYKISERSLRTKEFLKNIQKLKQAVEDELGQLCKSLLELKRGDQGPHSCPDNSHRVTSQVTCMDEKLTVLPTTANSKSDKNGSHQHCEDAVIEQSNKSLSMDELPGQGCQEPKKEYMQSKPFDIENQLSTYKEGHKSFQTCTTERLMPPVTLHCHPSHFSETYPKTLKYHCSQYDKPLQPNALPDMFKLVLPTAAIQTCPSTYPMQLEVPLCSGSIASLPQSLPQLMPPPFPAATFENVKFIGAHQHFLCPQTHGISRTPFYQIMMEPMPLPHVPITTNAVMCHMPVPLPYVSHTIYTPVHSQLPPLIPLHPLF